MPAMRQIVAFGGGGFSMESGNPLLDDYVLGLTGKAEPRVCFLPTASGDADHYLVRFYNAFRERARPSHISLFRRERGASDMRAHLLAQDLIYVGGGSLISLLGVWRAHGIDSILREAWEAGVVLCGLSAGSLCWFAEAVSGYHGEVNRVRGPRLPLAQQRRALRRRRTARRPSTATCSTECPPATRPRTAPRCASSATSWSRWSPRGPRPAPTSWSSRGPRVLRDAAGDPLPRRRLGTRGRAPGAPAVDRRLSRDGSEAPDPRPGRARVRPPQRQRRDLRPDRRARRVRRSRASACCRPRAATPRTRSRASAAPSASGTASPTVDLALPPGRASRWTCASSCSPRTRSTSAAAAWSTCSRSGGPTASTSCCASAGGRGSCSAARAPGAMCWFQGGITSSSGKPDGRPGARAAAGERLRPLSLAAREAQRAPRVPSPRASLPGGLGLEDQTAALFEDEQLPRSSRRGRAPAVWRVTAAHGARQGDGPGAAASARDAGDPDDEGERGRSSSCARPWPRAQSRTAARAAGSAGSGS